MLKHPAAAALPLLAFLGWGPAADAARPKRRPPVSRPASLDVTPSPEVEARVASEAAKGRLILDDLGIENVLASPYVVSAFYYHDGFLDDFPAERNNAAPERRIIGQISNRLTRQSKERFVRLLHDLWSRAASPAPERLTLPVRYKTVSSRRSHHFAVDLFAAEGEPVNAVSRGVVVLADANWDPDNLFSTSSRKGGNTVILFDPDHDRFYRYCHLSSVSVAPGDIVASGHAIGQVGHSGLNASRPGHGRHLHFEVNEYVGGHVRAVEYQRLRALLKSWRP